MGAAFSRRTRWIILFACIPALVVFGLLVNDPGPFSLAHEVLLAAMIGAIIATAMIMVLSLGRGG